MICSLSPGFRYVIVLLLAVLVFSSGPIKAGAEKYPEQDEILAIGTSAIVAGNVARARKAAISDALAKGVEEYLMRRLGSQVMVNNFGRVIQEVIPRAREEIENFNILVEEQIGKKHKILIRLKVNEKVVEGILREISLTHIKGQPIKILFLVSQDITGDGKVSYWWGDPAGNAGLTPTELNLYRVFQERGFNPVNRMSSIPEGRNSPEMKNLDLSDETAINWGKLFSTDVVIYGECRVIKGKEVNLTLKALDIEGNNIISQVDQKEMIDDTGQGMEPAVRGIEKAVNHIAARLGPAIITAFDEGENGLNQLEITINGLRSFKQFREFREFLERDIEGVRSVKQTRFKGNSISVSVGFEGEEERFMDLVINNENLPFQADMDRTEEGRIIFNIK